MTLDTRPKPFVFVLMPFSDDFTDIYQSGIKPACEAAGAYCERVDEQIYQGGILQRVYNQIAKADIIVADMTGKNPNVFYEAGYAHALGKTVILLTQRAEDIPFDLKDYPHIVYEGRIHKLKPELEKRIRWCIDHPFTELKSIEAHFEVYLNNQKLNSAAPCPVTARTFGSLSHLPLTVAIHNATHQLRAGPQQVGIEVPTEFEYADFATETRDARIQGTQTVETTVGRRLYVVPGTEEIAPDGWFVINFDAITSNRIEKSSPVVIKLTLYTKLRPLEYVASITCIYE